MSPNRRLPTSRRLPGLPTGLFGAAFAAALAAAAVPSSAADASASASPQAVYQRERAACLAGQTPQDRATCLKEAAAAREDARRGRLASGNDAAARAANAVRRCAVHDEADARTACERLARGEGRQQGSVAEGAVIREITTRKVSP